MLLDLRYVAGFFDGEGCVNITVSGQNRTPTLRVMITNTEPIILCMLQRQFGGQLTTPLSLNPQRGWKLHRCLDFRNSYAFNFIRKIESFCVLKNPQIE